MLIDVLRGSMSFPQVVTYILAMLVIILLILPFHEWAHAFVALKLGDVSIKYRKRLTLNPLEHIDYMGALCMLLFGFGWAKPVPVDSRYFKNPKVGMAITAVAGPVSNVIAAMAGGLIYNAVYTFGGGTSISYYVLLFLGFYITVNCCLAAFNILPIPPLDGSKVLFAFLPDRIVAKFYQYQQYFFIAIMALLWLGFLTGPLVFLQNNLTKFVLWISGLPFAPFV